MGRWWKLWKLFAGVSIQAQLEHRASLALQVAGQFVVTCVDFVAIAFAFSRYGALGGWSLGEVAVLYGFADAAFALADALSRGFELVGPMVRSGDFDRLLLRPAPVALQLLGHEFTLRRIGRFAQGAAILAWGAVACGLSPGPTGALALALGFAGLVVTFVSILSVNGALAFRASDSLEIVNVASYGGKYVASYPLDVFRSWLRNVFLFVVPIGCMVYLPACAALGRQPFGSWPEWIGLLSPLACAPFALLALALWSSGLRRYRSTGS